MQIEIDVHLEIYLSLKKIYILNELKKVKLRYISLKFSSKTNTFLIFEIDKYPWYLDKRQISPEVTKL